MKRLLLVLAALFTAQAEAEGGPYNDYSYPPSEWPSLSRVAVQVPGFAGLTYGEGGVQMMLTDLSQSARLRGVLGKDARWMHYPLAPGALRAGHSVAELIAAAEAVKSARPQTQIRVNLVLNRVTVNTSVEQTAVLARQLKLGKLLVSEAAPTPLKVQVTPTRLSLREVKAASFGYVRLKVVITNPIEFPVQFSYGCGGALNVEALTLEGEKLPYAKIACTGELRLKVLQPGKSYDFPGFSNTDLSTLKPGKYVWAFFQSGQRISFTLTR